MLLLNSQELKQADHFTMENEPISSIDLMERAASKCAHWISGKFEKSVGVHVFCGPGNNGGDGLAIARILLQKGYDTQVYILGSTDNSSEEFKINEKRWVETGKATYRILSRDEFPPFEQLSGVFIDALFGYGLSRPIDGIFERVVEQLNASNLPIVSIDLPSGLGVQGRIQDGNEAIISAHTTLTFQFPKLSFLLPEFQNWVGNFVLLDIGIRLPKNFTPENQYYYVDIEYARSLYIPPTKFSHKGLFGHLLVIAGSKGKIGAATLATKSAQRSGAGLVTSLVPRCGYEVMQTLIPEAMCIANEGKKVLRGGLRFKRHSHVLIGPGIGTSQETISYLESVLNVTDNPMAIDADALNILSLNRELLKKIPANSILSPHPKEFERLVGSWENDVERLEKQIEFSTTYQIIVILKGAHTSTSMPNGEVFFNSTGNPGMSTGGSGDVLIGIVGALLARNYPPEHAAILAVYIHGLAGDIALDKQSVESLIASDIIHYLGKAFHLLADQDYKMPSDI